MTKILNLRLIRAQPEDLFAGDIQIDWDNDRHQVGRLSSFEADDVILCLTGLLRTCITDKLEGQI